MRSGMPALGAGACGGPGRRRRARRRPAAAGWRSTLRTPTGPGRSGWRASVGGHGQRTSGSGACWDKGGERDRAAPVTGAVDQVVAVGVDGGAERRGDDLQVGDFRLHLCQLGPGARLQSGLGALAVPVTARVRPATSSRVNPSRWAALMTRSAVTASAGYSRCPPRLRSRLSEQAAAFVVPQGLQVHSGRAGDLAAPQPGHAAITGGDSGWRARRDAPRANRYLHQQLDWPAGVAPRSEGEGEERTALAFPGGQIPAGASAAASSRQRSRVGAGRCCPRSARRRRTSSSNSASRNGRSAVGRVHASRADPAR